RRFEAGRSRSISVHGRKLQQRDFERKNDSDSVRSRYNSRSSSAHRRRRMMSQGDRRFTEVGKDSNRSQCSRSKDGRSMSLVDGGGMYAGGKDNVGGVFEGRGKELKDGGDVNVGIKHCDDYVSGSNLKR
ncbi:hypothetical protein L195_g059401, partial [Trifolium pratense]